MGKQLTQWQKVWSGIEMEREVREQKKGIKRAKIRKNRHDANNAIKKENYDSFELNEWDNLSGDDFK